ncbi:MAG: 30S ribosomal protein S20 [Rhodospirillaceae bacterium]|jgi:small subunit ribosomal protein S20|nr:30S ribosomal protein S20 [Rhodospirillales bacterium]MBT3907738.1 30S ribosomal protein S20 [Rhodospirillaceae bacterium]MBT4700097.1 30S ribosomal protein S20 [Rhodospirillaceae bacterium]MBT5035174.1 30S ribosomal protein S20 [Rhodospirillaceae bacterium]MBT6220161.1 30S ribosomal protein S20 [Rhodospirillaceae bacterium]
MAHHASAKKRIRQTLKRTEVNNTRRGRIRSFIRKVEEAIESGDQAQAQTAFREMQPELMRGAQKGILHRNTASRKLSRLSVRIKAMAA